MGHILRDAAWAWRTVRARPRRTVLSAALVGVSLAAATLIFSAADSMVFHRVPYADPDRLVEIRGGLRGGNATDNFVTAALLDEWRKQTTLFAGVEGYLTKNLFLVDDSGAEMVPTADVTIGLIDLLGAKPRWGRAFIAGDDQQLALQPVLIEEQLARRWFGDPARAVGRQLATTAQPLLVVGVMGADFRFPSGNHRIWRALDPRGELARGFVGVMAIARLEDGLPFASVSAAVEQRAADVGQAAGRGAYTAQLGPLRVSQAGAQQRSMFLVLLAAAVCMVLIACANVASLELTDAVYRARSYAVLLALGASRAAIARVAVFECGAVVALATAIAVPLAVAGGRALPEYLPDRFTGTVVNRIDVDARALIFMGAIIVATWLATALPLALAVTRARVADLLKLDSGAAGSRTGARTRQALTMMQVAIAVLLLASSVLFARSYATLVTVDKGFDTTGVASVSITIPPQIYSAPGEIRGLAAEIVTRLRSHPGVIAATDATPPSAMSYAQSVTRVELDNGDSTEGKFSLLERDVTPEYFSVLRIPLVAGRVFAAEEPATNVIISEAFASRFFPGRDPIGGRFSVDPRRPWRTVIGVARQVDIAEAPARSDNERTLLMYVPRQRPAPISPSTKAVSSAGGSYAFISLVVRVDSPERLEDVTQIVRQSAGKLRVTTELVDDAYARRYDGLLLTTRIVSSFGLLAFLVGAAGVYGVMMLLVAQRTREIGIRMAVGAGRKDIISLVLRSSVRLTVIGALVGTAASLAAARWIESQLYGARAIDPLVLATVAGIVSMTAIAATLHPARIAARVEPSTLLRA